MKDWKIPAISFEKTYKFSLIFKKERKNASFQRSFDFPLKIQMHPCHLGRWSHHSPCSSKNWQARAERRPDLQMT